MTVSLCVVPEMVVLVMLVDLLILASILPSIILVVLPAGVGWLGFFSHASGLGCVCGLHFHVEAPVLTCFLLCLFYCCYISKLVRLSSWFASSWPLWLVLCLVVFVPQNFAKIVFLVASEL